MRNSSHIVVIKIAYYLNMYKEYPIDIVDHTDNIGDVYKNHKLSYERANVVKNLLIKEGVEGNRITTYGFGSCQPIFSNLSEDEGRNGLSLEYLKT
jgi:outer membrane protein OmpA-like peptidoglycan-associated protein